MSVSLKEYQKNKNYLLCVDSDGCAMDTMNIKHIRCFGPCFADEWNITEGPDREKLLKRWNKINLFEITRGINRFKGLARILCEMDQSSEDYKEFRNWADTAKELSEGALEKIESSNSVFKKALNWSRKVNQSIKQLPDSEKKAFDGVQNGLALAKEKFDIAIVSSANYAAVVEEWERCGILEYTDVVTTQQDGSKAHCISELIQKGYDSDHVIMCGDAEGDLKAAESNHVAFYPILVNKEKQSWDRLQSVLDEFVADKAEETLASLRKEFFDNLTAK